MPNVAERCVDVNAALKRRQSRTLAHWHTPCRKQVGPSKNGGSRTKNRKEPLNPPGSGSEVVIENGERVFVSPGADVALYDVRPGDEVDARYIEHGNGDKSMLSLVPPLNELQAP